MNAAISSGALARYGILALPLAFSGLPLYVYAPDFYTTQFGVSLALMGVILMVVRGIDAIQDPLIGWICDSYPRYRPVVVVIAAAMLGGSFFMLYHPPMDWAIWWFALSMVIATSAFSVLSILLNSTGSLWSRDALQKTRITSWREAFGLAGVLVATILPQILSAWVGSSMAYHLYAVVFLIFLFPSAALFVMWHAKADLARTSSPRLNWHIFKAMKNGFGKFFVIYGLSMLASSIPAILVLFFIRDRLGAESFTGLFLLLYFAAGIAGMPLWKSLSAAMGLERAWAVGMVVAVACFAWASFLTHGQVWPYAVICILSGFALGSDLALPPAILSHMIDRDALAERSATLFAVMGFVGKAALAVASFTSFFLLDLFAFQPGRANDPQALAALGLIYAALPCVIKAVSAGAMLWVIREKGAMSCHDSKPSF